MSEARNGRAWEEHAEVVIGDDERKRMKSGPSAVEDPAGGGANKPLITVESQNPLSSYNSHS